MDERRQALKRISSDSWPVLQGAIAATLAWVIADLLVGGHDPFFAPIAAFVGLNASLGERGLNAVRLLFGAVIGIAAGELTVAALGDGYASLALAVLAATAVARGFGGARIVLAQAAAGANGEAGTQRLTDALIGVGVALVFSQVLFSPEPLALLRRAESAALADMAEGLRLTARALEFDDDDVAEQAMSRLRSLRDRLSELGETRAASGRVARRSAAWRGQIAPVVRETEDAGRLDLLGGSCLSLTRGALATDQASRRRLAPHVSDLAEALRDLAGSPGDRSTRQQAADRALDVARRLAAGPAPVEPEAVAAAVALRTVAGDLMVFAGVDAEQADAAVREGTGEFRVPAPPSSSRAPFGLGRSTGA